MDETCVLCWLSPRSVALRPRDVGSCCSEAGCLPTTVHLPDAPWANPVLLSYPPTLTNSSPWNQ